MSLDVYLEQDEATIQPTSGIFIRESGGTREISEDEWNKRFPDREPCRLVNQEPAAQLYRGNVTHNLNTMAMEAGIYEYLWRPDEIEITKAAQLIEHLTVGLDTLRSDPERFKEFNPPNGWGDYEGLVDFVANYLAACQLYPDASIRVWR